MKTLTVTVRDREGVQFQSRASAITSTNEDGLFDILPGHAHFFSLIRNEVQIHVFAGQKTSFPVTSGMISVVDDEVTVLLGVLPERENPLIERSSLSKTRKLS